IPDRNGSYGSWKSSRFPTSTVSRRSSIRRSQWQGLATGAAGEGSRQRDREASSDRGDRIFDVPFGSDWRRLGVWDARIAEAFRAAGGLRGESPLVRG